MKTNKRSDERKNEQFMPECDFALQVHIQNLKYSYSNTEMIRMLARCGVLTGEEAAGLIQTRHEMMDGKRGAV